MFTNLISHFSPFATLDRIRSLFFEKRCAVCRTPHIGDGLICMACSDKIIKGPDNVCALCGTTIPIPGQNEAPCIACRPTPPLHKKLYFYGPYEGLLRDLILDWKFNSNFGYGSILSQLAVKTAQKISVNSTPDIIIPVPLHPSRLRERGFNQSLIIGRSVAKSLTVKISDQALVRTRKTTPQTTLSKNKRSENIKDAFIADKSIIANKKILIIDDVYTTGSTARECTQTLYSAGATQVEVLVLAKPLI